MSYDILQPQNQQKDHKNLHIIDILTNHFNNKIQGETT